MTRRVEWQGWGVKSGQRQGRALRQSRQRRGEFSSWERQYTDAGSPPALRLPSGEVRLGMLEANVANGDSTEVPGESSNVRSGRLPTQKRQTHHYRSQLHAQPPSARPPPTHPGSRRGLATHISDGLGDVTASIGMLARGVTHRGASSPVSSTSFAGVRGGRAPRLERREKGGIVPYDDYFRPSSIWRDLRQLTETNST